MTLGFSWSATASNIKNQISKIKITDSTKIKNQISKIKNFAFCLLPFAF